MHGSIATDNEKRLSAQLYEALFANDASMPFSFKLGGRFYHGFDADFAIEHKENEIVAVHKSGLTFAVKLDRNDGVVYMGDVYAGSGLTAGWMAAYRSGAPWQPGGDSVRSEQH
mgnify:CR=1 FL=1